MATDVQIQIGANADVVQATLQKVDNGYTALLNKARQVYQEMESPITAVANKAKHTREYENLNSRAYEIEQRLARVSLEQSQGMLGPASGPGYTAKLINDLEKTNLERQVSQFDMIPISQRSPSGAGVMKDVMGKGRFLGRKALGYGGMIAGGMGAFSLLSGIFGRMDDAEERNRRFATSVSVGRGRSPLDYADAPDLYEVNNILERMGHTAFMTTKEMLPFIDVLDELASTFKSTDLKFISRLKIESLKDNFTVAANIGKSFGVETPILAGFLTAGMRQGSLGGVEGTRMASMLMLNENMTHRATEAIQSMQQMMTGTVGGTQGLGASGMFNLMQTLNSSPFLAYRGAGGAQRMLGINQAFIGGGNENMQYFQSMALNPAFQEINRRRLSGFGGDGGPTNYGTGRYDQLIADVFQELGAFATSGDVGVQLSQMGFSGAAAYISEKYKDPNKMNIERLFDQYRGAYGSENEGRRFLMTAQMSKDMGVSFSDIGVLDEALRDREFMRRSQEKGLGLGDVAQSWKNWKEAGGKIPEMEKYIKEKTKNEDLFQAMADSLKSISDDLIPLTNTVLGDISAFTSTISTGVDRVANFFNAGEGQSATEINAKNRQAVSETFDTVINSLDTIVQNFITWAEKPGNKKIDLNLSGMPGATTLE